MSIIIIKMTSLVFSILDFIYIYICVLGYLKIKLISNCQRFILYEFNNRVRVLYVELVGGRLDEINKFGSRGTKNVLFYLLFI